MKSFNSTFNKEFKLNLVFLKFLFVISFIIISINFYEWVNEKSYYEYTDWLINYQGGFTRRGLIGEIVFQIHDISLFRLDLILYFFVISLYLIFFIFLNKILSKTELNFINSLILFSPLSFLYFAASKTMAGRKEILFFSLVVIFFYKFENIKFEYIKFWIIFILVISTLSHLGFIFYIPFLILFSFFAYPNRKTSEYISQLIPILISGILIVAAISYTTIFSKPDINLICDSIEKYTNNCPENTYLRVFTYSIDNILNVNQILFQNNYLIKYPIYYFLSFFPIYYGLFNLNNNGNYKAKKLIYILVGCSILTIPVFLLGADYGRYMQWQYMLFLLIYLKVINLNILKMSQKNVNLLKKIPYHVCYFVIIIYGFFWSVPHCCEKDFSFLFDKVFLRLVN